MVHFKSNFNTVLLMLVVYISLNGASPDMEGFNNCKEKLDAFFGLTTSSHECAKKVITDILLSWDNLDAAVKLYIFTLRSHPVTCVSFKNIKSLNREILLKLYIKHQLNKIEPQDLFCGRRVYGSIRSSGIAEIEGSYDECINETKLFGKRNIDIYRNAIDDHKIGQLNSAHPGRLISYFIHQPGSFGEAYLLHIADVVILPEWCDPIPYCRWRHHIPNPGEDV